MRIDKWLWAARFFKTRSLAQQVLTDSTIPGIAALAAHQLAKTTLRGGDPITGRLLEQASGEVFDAGAFTQTRAVQQPFGHAHRKTLGRGNTWGCGSY